MAAGIEWFAAAFSKLKINSGKVITLSEEDTFLTKNVKAVSLGSYLKELKQFL